MNRLGRREKLMLGLGIAVVGLILIHAFVISPALAAHQEWKQAVRTQERNLADILELSEKHQLARASASGDWEKLMERTNFSLDDLLGKMARRSGVMNRTKYIKSDKKPMANGVFIQTNADIKLDGVTLEQLLDLLYRIETSDNFLSVRRITVNGSAKEDDYTVSAVLQVTTMERSKTAGAEKAGGAS